MNERAGEKLSELYDRYLSAGIDGSLSKIGEAPPTAEEVAARLANPAEGEEGKTKEENARKAGEKLEQAGDASTIQQVTPGSPQPLKLEDVPESPGGVKEEGPTIIEKQASEILAAVDEQVVSRYHDETVLRKYASDVFDTMRSDIQEYQRQRDLTDLSKVISSRVAKKAQEEAPVPPEVETDMPSETPETPEVDTAVAPGSSTGSTVSMDELPPEIQQEIESLVMTLSEQTGLPPEQVLEQLNQISEEQFGNVSPEELTGELSKAAAEIEYEELTKRLEKLSAEMANDEVPDESVPPETAESVPAVEGEDEMAAALLDGRSDEEIAALQEAIQELEAQGVPPEVIEEAAKEVLSGEVPEEVAKVASDEDWENLNPKHKVVGVLAYRLANASRN